MSRRVEQVNQFLQKEVGNIILKDLDFSRDVMITITGVETSSDLQQAKIKVSILPFLKAEKIFRILNYQIFNIQKALNQKVKMKVVPKIKFELDISGEKTDRINTLLKNNL